MKLSLSAFLFEENQKQMTSFEKFCDIAYSSGYDAVELRQSQVSPVISKTERLKILETCSEHNLEISCLTARGLPEEQVARNDFFMRYLELCSDLNCELLKISADVEWLNRAAGVAADFGVCLATNNHINTELETVKGTKRRLEDVNNSNYGLLYDPMHLYINGENYLEGIDLFKDSIKNVLLHSVRPGEKSETPAITYKGKSWVIALPDENGVQDWKSIAEKLKQVSYDGLFTVIESGWPDNMREDIARKYALYFRLYLKEL